MTTDTPTVTQDDTCTLDPRLLEFLVCPLTRDRLIYDKENQELISKEANLAYPIRDGIPIMLPDEARSLTDTGSSNQAV